MFPKANYYISVLLKAYVKFSKTLAKKLHHQELFKYVTVLQKLFTGIEFKDLNDFAGTFLSQKHPEG